METVEFDLVVTGGLTWARIAVLGELDLSTADELREALDQEMRNGRSVILDLSQVAFVDSTGLTVILRTMQAAQEGRWNFGVAAELSPAALRTIRVAGVLPLLPLVEES
ncbi:MAG: STAS domain-containing protein [Solirubrobacteraceae bacterium]